jgi:hypothetical protein
MSFPFRISSNFDVGSYQLGTSKKIKRKNRKRDPDCYNELPILPIVKPPVITEDYNTIETNVEWDDTELTWTEVTETLSASKLFRIYQSQPKRIMLNWFNHLIMISHLQSKKCPSTLRLKLV